VIYSYGPRRGLGSSAVCYFKWAIRAPNLKAPLSLS
jgi:hypothetical protein